MKVLDVEQGSPEWYEARSGIPTVSEFGRFITPAKGAYSTQARGYIADLIVESVQGPSEGMSTYYMDRGTILEDEARSWYEFEKDVDIETCGLVFNRGAGWSPDGLMFDVLPDERVVNFRGLEIKCPKPSTHVKYLLENKLPDEYRPQCHGALLIGELEWLDFISYCPGFATLCIRITPDDYTEIVKTNLKRFLEDYEHAKARIIGKDTGTH